MENTDVGVHLGLGCSFYTRESWTVKVQTGPDNQTEIGWDRTGNVGLVSIGGSRVPLMRRKDNRLKDPVLDRRPIRQNTTAREFLR